LVKEQGRKFAYVPIVTNIIETRKGGEIWVRPHFAIEDALKHCIGEYLG
jgi:hypothetical protein